MAWHPDPRDAIVDLHFQRSPITAATVVGSHFGQIATFDCVWATVAEKRDGQVPSKCKNHGCRKRVVAFIIEMLCHGAVEVLSKTRQVAAIRRGNLYSGISSAIMRRPNLVF